jgi:hypothetical protein
MQFRFILNKETKSSGNSSSHSSSNKNNKIAYSFVYFDLKEEIVNQDDLQLA